jgi:hypothetical protein
MMLVGSSVKYLLIEVIFTAYKKQLHLNSYHYNFAGEIFASCWNTQFLLVRRLNLISLNVINIKPQYGQWQTNHFFSGHLMESRKPLPQPLSEGRTQKLGDQNMGPSRDYSLK